MEAYERASQKEPQNEELLTHLFMGYVRLGQAKQQRHAALALHRLRHKNPYYFWAVMSLVVEAGQPDTSAVERSTLLLLAQRMVDKFVKEGRLEAEAGGCPRTLAFRCLRCDSDRHVQRPVPPAHPKWSRAAMNDVT